MKKISENSNRKWKFTPYGGFAKPGIFFDFNARVKTKPQHSDLFKFYIYDKAESGQKNAHFLYHRQARSDFSKLPIRLIDNNDLKSDSFFVHLR